MSSKLNEQTLLILMHFTVRVTVKMQTTTTLKKLKEYFVCSGCILHVTAMCCVLQKSGLNT